MIRHLRTIFPLLCALLLGAALSSCHKKSPAAEDISIGVVTVDTPAPDNIPAAPAGFAATNGLWKSLETPVNIRISQPVNFGIKGRLTMVKDSWLLLSLRFMGMEVGQLYMDTDSVFIIEKMKRTYYSAPLAGAQALTGMDLGLMQGFLIGRPTAMPHVPQSVFPMLMTDMDTGMVEGLALLSDAREVLRITYGAPVETPTGPTASGVDFALILPRFRADASLSWEASHMKWDTMPENKFSRPGARYTRLTDAQLLNLLKTLGQ